MRRKRDKVLIVKGGLRLESVAEATRLGQELIELFIVQTAIDEFFPTEDTIGVLVHHPKDVQRPFIRLDLSFMLISLVADQFVDRLERERGSFLLRQSLRSPLTLMIRRISVSSIDPSPLQSYIRKAMSSFLSGVPCEVMLIAWRNSLKSIFPLLSRRRTRERDARRREEKTFTRVERPEDMFTEVLGAAFGKELLVDLNECLPGQVTVGTISLEKKTEKSSSEGEEERSTMKPLYQLLIFFSE